MSRGRFDRRGRGTTVWLPGMGSRLHGNDEWEPGMGSRLHGNDEWLPGMGSRLHGNDEWEPGMGSRLHGNDGLVAGDGFPLHGNDGWAAGDGFPSARERRLGCRGWVPVCTGTTVGLPGMGSRLHGNDGWVAGGWFPAAPTGADTWVRPYGWSRAHPPHRIPHPHRTGEGGFQTRPYGSRDRGAPTGAVIGDGFPPRIEYGAGSSASSGQAQSAEGGVMGGQFLLAGIGLKAGMGDC